MALHEQLFPLLVSAYHGAKVRPLGLSGGSINYKLMDAFTAYIVDPSKVARVRCLSLLSEMETIGHLTLEGPHGIQYECGAPGMHWTFNVGSVLAGLVYAIRRKDALVIQACERFIITEIWLDAQYAYRGIVIMPCSRVKDEKNHKPVDGYRNAFLLQSRGFRLKRGDKFWSSPQSFVPVVMRELQSHYDMKLISRFKAIDEPKLYLPIQRQELPGGGFIAWIDDNDLSRQALGRDGCNWVRAAPDGLTWGYDWSEVPLE